MLLIFIAIVYYYLGRIEKSIQDPGSSRRREKHVHYHFHQNLTLVQGDKKTIVELDKSSIFQQKSGEA